MFKCTMCEEKHEQLPDLLSHIEEEHGDSIPKDQSVEQYYYMTKTGKTHGSCVVCRGNTGWNEATGKYHRFCKNPKCKETYRDTFKKRMIGTYGKVTLLNDPEHQKKMLANRAISGKYKWRDGVEFIYTGSYELDFLKFLDQFMGFDSSDIMAPSPHTYYYMYNGEKKFYMPDFFIPSLNLEIEIKDGGDNENRHHKIQAVDKVKEKLKDEVLKSQKQFSYIKVVNKQYDNFFDCLIAMKKGMAENGKLPQVFDIADNKGLIIKGPVMENMIADYFDYDQEFVLEMIQSVDSSKVVDNIMEGTTASEQFKEVVKNYKEFLDCNTNHLLQDIEEYTRHHDYECTTHNVSDYLKKMGIINTPIKTPGFTSAHTGNLFLNILESLVTTDVYDHKYIKGIQDEFKESILSNGTSETIARYQKDCKLMTYYLKLLADKLDKKRLVISDINKTFEQIVTEAAYNVEGEEAHPVYVLLTHTGTVLSNIIKGVTKNPYSHASIAFDPELREMYSFGRKYKNNPLIGTFVREDIQSGLYGDVLEHADYALYVTFVKPDQLAAMRKRLDYFKEAGSNFKYSFKGLINYKMGKESDSIDSFFCSQFVDHILSAGRPYFDRHSSLVQPIDFAKHSDFYFVSKGKLKDYDVTKVEAKVAKISKKAKFEKKKTNEPAVIYVGVSKQRIGSSKTSFVQASDGFTKGYANLPALVKDQGETVTHYTLIPTSKLKKKVNLIRTNDGFLIDGPIEVETTNINKL